MRTRSYPHRNAHLGTRGSYRINRHLSGWILPPLMIRAFGAHRQQQTHAVQQTARHSTTRSAMASSPGGKVNPSVFAVFKLMTNSNVAGCWTGRSEGFAPFSI